MSEPITFRLTDNLDPEERLEEAALWKAIYDASGGTAKAVTGGVPATFGRLLKGELDPVLDYWNDWAFRAEAQRSFAVCSLNEAFVAVDLLHETGSGAFVKSTRNKHSIFRCPVGSPLRSVMGDMVYSFIDGGPSLMVQALVEMTYEWRFFCVDRKIVADSPNHLKLTPLDWPMLGAYRTPQDAEPTCDTADVWDNLMEVACRIASGMRRPTAVIDCAFINGEPGCVELNSLRLGQVGLFACDVRALAEAAIAEHNAQATKEPK